MRSVKADTGTMSLSSLQAQKSLVAFFTILPWLLRSYKSIYFIRQLCISYGPRYLSNPRFERQDHLRGAYDFVCRCVACEEDWPLLDDVPSFPSG